VTVGGSSTNWTVATRTGALKMFTSANSYAGGGIGGLSGADTLCQTEANSAGYSGTYQAVMSSDSVSAASRLTLSYPIVNAYNGSTIAATNLWAGSISTAILTPSGGNAPGYHNIFSGTTNTGAIYTSNTCSGWTSVAPTSSTGKNDQVGNQYWIYQTDTANCSSSFPIYCIQQ
jgi:hypothetical protein